MFSPRYSWDQFLERVTSKFRYCRGGKYVKTVLWKYDYKHNRPGYCPYPGRCMSLKSSTAEYKHYTAKLYHIPSGTRD